MSEQESFQMEASIEAALEELLAFIGKSDVIQRYQKIEDQAKNNAKLLALAEEIKAAQKEAVKFAHYGKPVAEQEALKVADAKMKEFDEHPLVVTYRQRLIAANELLQYVSTQIERSVNVTLDLCYQDVLEKLSKN